MGAMNYKSIIWGMAAVGTLVAAPAWAELKIGVVDYGRLVEESPQAKAALDSIRTEFTPRQRDLQTQQILFSARWRRPHRSSPNAGSKAQGAARPYRAG